MKHFIYGLLILFSVITFISFIFIIDNILGRGDLNKNKYIIVPNKQSPFDLVSWFRMDSRNLQSA